MGNYLKILHCVPDDKFIDGWIEQAQQMWKDCYHEYAFIAKKPNIEFKYIHNKDIIKRFGYHEIISYIKNKSFNIIILHNLYSIPFFDLLKIPKEIKVVWFAWGFDIYMPTYLVLRPLIKKDLLYSRTKQVKRSGFDSFKYNLQIQITKLIRFWHYKEMKAAIYRIDYFSGVIPEEYEMIITDKHNNHFRAKPLYFNYSNIKRKGHLNDPVVSGYNIQIGNSGDTTNNHIDVMQMLLQFNLGNKKIYCPISYSGPKYYREKVIKEGRRYFGENFCPLVSFIPYDQYIKSLSSTRYAIFAMERQQAMGNIISGLWEGRMVFLSETNPVYSSLKKRGFIIYTIQHDLSRIERNEIMADEDVQINRKQIIKYFSFEAELEKTEKIIKILQGSN